MKSTNKRQNKESNRHEWIGLAFLFLGIFFAAGLINVAWTGWIGRWVIHWGAASLLGRSVVVIPLLGIGIGIALMMGARRWRQMVVSGVGVGLTLSVTLEMVVFQSPHAWIWPLPQNGGGLVGWLLYWASYKMVGNLGTTLWCIGVILVGIGLWFEYSFMSPFRSIALFFKGATVPVDTLETHAPPRGSRRIKAMVDDRDFEDAVVIKAAEELEPEVLESAVEIPEVVEKRRTSAPRLVIDADSTDYQFPPIGLLDPGLPSQLHSKENVKLRQSQAKILEETLASFQVTAKVVNIAPGPSVTRFELEPGVGVKVAKITALAKDIALKLATADVRIEAPIPGKALVGIEVPNTQTDTVTLRGLLEKTDFYRSSSKLMAAIGLTITGDPTLMDLAKMPHVLIAGATGSGKSVCVNVLILSILLRAKPDEVKFLMIDPKKVELSLYEGIPHLVAPVVTDPHKAAATLNKWALVEMEKRYEVFSKVGVKNIEGFNQWVADQEKLKESGSADDGEGAEHIHLQRYPYIVVIIDELADLMMVASQEVENTICRLAQMSRATGIHLVIATQRPSVDVVTGLIKANVPSRISFFLQSQIDSRTILDMAGAEKLLGKGDMLYSPVGAFKPQRAQGVFVSEREVKAIVQFLKAQGEPTYVDAILDVEPLAPKGDSAASDQDELFEEAKQIVMSTQYASTSYLQRKLRIGYNRAARLMEELEKQGIVSHAADRRRTPSS